jgi:hypothetical protein
MTGSRQASRQSSRKGVEAAAKAQAEVEAKEALLLASLEELNTKLHTTYGSGAPPADPEPTAVAAAVQAASPSSNGASAAPSKRKKIGVKKGIAATTDGKVWDGKGGKGLSDAELKIKAARAAYGRPPKIKAPKKDYTDPILLRSVNDMAAAMAAMEAANRT